MSRNIDKISLVNTYFHNNEKSSTDAGLQEPVRGESNQGVKIDVEYQTLEGRKRTPFLSVFTRS